MRNYRVHSQRLEAFQEKKNKDSLVEAQQHLLNYLSSLLFHVVDKS